MSKYLSQKIITSFLLVAMFSLLVLNIAYATPRFQPGETLNPDCAPTDTDCAVVPPTTSTEGGTVLYNTPIYTTNIKYQHPRDPSEINGNTTYSSSFPIVGMYEQMPSDTVVSAIEANVWDTNTSGDVTLKLFERPTTAAFNPDSITPLYSGVISHTIMPHSSITDGFHFNLSSSVTVSAGQYLFVIWESSTGGELKIVYFNADSSAVPYRHYFILGSHNQNFGYTSAGYSAATFRVYGNTDITATLVPTLGTEMLTNPGFETLGGSYIWSGWTSGGSSGITDKDETVITHSGGHAGKLISNGGAWYTSQITTSQMTVVPGQKYQLSFWTRGDGVNAMQYSLYDVTHTTYLVQQKTTGVSTTTYTQFTTNFTAPTGCDKIVVYFSPVTVSGATAYVDDVSLKLLTNIRTPIPVSVQSVLNNLSTPTSLNVSFSDPNSVMTSTNARDAILEAYNHASNTTSNSSGIMLSIPRIILPDTLYAVVGDKLQLFTRGMIEAQNPYNLPYTMNSQVGNAYPRYFEYTPVVGDVGNKSFTLQIYNNEHTIINTKTINLKVSNPTEQPATPKNILTLGDSLTSGGVWPAELYRRLTQTGGTPAGLGYSNINFIGDKNLPGYSTQAYTGYGGWSFPRYTGTASVSPGHVLSGTFDKDKTDVNSTWLDSNGNTWTIEYATGGLKIHGSATLPTSGTLTHVSGATHTSNIIYTSATTEPETPFWDTVNNRFSFSSWATRNSYSSIDAVYVLLGWNSTGGANVSDYSSYMADVRVFLDKLHTDFPNAIVRLVGIQVPSVNGGMGANYGASNGNSDYFGQVRSVNFMNIAYQNLANESAYSSWVKFISIAPQFDSENNMPQALTAVNSRNTAAEYRGTNGVHPDTTGYYQIADAVYREFVSTFLSN